MAGDSEASTLALKAPGGSSEGLWTSAPVSPGEPSSLSGEAEMYMLESK
jgi:hypothetical protein